MIEAAELTPDKLRAMPLPVLKSLIAYLGAARAGALDELAAREETARRQGGSIMAPHSVAVRHKSKFEA